MNPSGPQISEKSLILLQLISPSSKLQDPPHPTPFPDVFRLANRRSEVDWFMGWGWIFSWHLSQFQYGFWFLQLAVENQIQHKKPNRVALESVLVFHYTSGRLAAFSAGGGGLYAAALFSSAGPMDEKGAWCFSGNYWISDPSPGGAVRLRNASMRSTS